MCLGWVLPQRWPQLAEENHENAHKDNQGYKSHVLPPCQWFGVRTHCRFSFICVFLCVCVCVFDLQSILNALTHLCYNYAEYREIVFGPR
jgi:hypothetical protein